MIVPRRDRIWMLDELLDARPWKREGFLVTTNGCFDLLHVGHLRVLEFAWSFGGYVAALLNSDASIERLKGPGRPFIPEGERARLVGALRCVDAVVVFDADDPCAILDALRPAIHVKGGDWSKQDLPETEIVERHGGRIEILPRDEGPSTSEIAGRVRR